MRPITIWRFEDAPKEYKEMSPHGGDEDWVARVDVEYGDSSDTNPPYISWLEEGTSFGCCGVSHHYDGHNRVWIFIGAHA